MILKLYIRINVFHYLYFILSTARTSKLKFSHRNDCIMNSEYKIIKYSSCIVSLYIEWTQRIPINDVFLPPIQKRTGKSLFYQNPIKLKILNNSTTIEPNHKLRLRHFASLFIKQCRIYIAVVLCRVGMEIEQ